MEEHQNEKQDGAEVMLAALLRAAVATEGGLEKYLAGDGDVAGEPQRTSGLPGPLRMAVLFEAAMGDATFACALAPQYGAVKALFAQAMNASKCPCGSGRMYGDCCKAGERLAFRAIRDAVDARQKADAPQAAPGPGKFDAAMAAAQVLGTEWAIVLLPSAGGGVAMQAAGCKPGDPEPKPLPLDRVAGVLAAMHDESLVQMAMRRVFESMQHPQRRGPQMSRRMDG